MLHDPFNLNLDELDNLVSSSRSMSCQVKPLH
jgi:hypothetical protein